MRLFCGRCASIVRLRAHYDTIHYGHSEKISLRIDHRKIMGFAFHLRNVDVGITFHASDFTHVSMTILYFYQWRQCTVPVP